MKIEGIEVKILWGRVIVIIGLFILLGFYVYGVPQAQNMYEFSISFAIIMVYGILLMKLNPLKVIKK